jgi:D-tyrosyl-tRNA(Tyr) deacylase
MRAVIQRVKWAEVSVNGETCGQIQSGLVIFLGIAKDDQPQDADYLAEKIGHLRVFNDEQGKMNLSLKDIGGSALIISQFTLYGDCRRGRRPSFTEAAAPDRAVELYHYFISRMEKNGIRTATGRFQAMMEITLLNDGPVTLLLDSKKTF